jgi:hypothetical protein
VRINNNNSLDLTAARGETLTLSLQAGDALVTFSGLGARGQLQLGVPQAFTVPMAGTDLPILVRATFKDTSGGLAAVRFNDANGNAASFTFHQFPDSATDAVVFLIDIE